MGREKSPNLSDLVRSLRWLQHCRVCNAGYKSDRMRLIDQTPNGSVIHLTCPRCTHAALAFIGSTPGGGMGCLGMITDLSATDAERLRDHVEINEDELISAADFIRSHSFQLVSYIYYQINFSR